MHDHVHYNYIIVSIQSIFIRGSVSIDSFKAQSLNRVHYYTDMQWNLRIKDTLGPAVLSTIEGLSSSQRSKNLWEMIVWGYFKLPF